MSSDDELTSAPIPLFDPDVTESELAVLQQVLASTPLSQGPLVASFEQAFAQQVGRRHAIAVSSGMAAMRLALQGLQLGVGDEIILSPYSFRELGHAVLQVGATPVFSEIDYWSQTLSPAKLIDRITERTRAIIGLNTNGHPCDWTALEQIAEQRGLLLIEDSSEAIGSRWRGRQVGSFGRCSVFDFSAPFPLACGEGGMVVTDDDDLAQRIRALRSRRLDQRQSVSMTSIVPVGEPMSDLTAGLALVQLRRLDDILQRRKQIETWYFDSMKSFEGIKDPYHAPEVDEWHWMVYAVHLGTRFTLSARDQILEDLATEDITAVAFAVPLHLQRAYIDRFGSRRGMLPVTEKIADRAVALPFHAHIEAEQITFIVKTMKDSSVNVGAGAAIYL